MLHELTKAVEEFDTVSDDELGYCGGEILDLYLKIVITNKKLVN